MSAFNEVLNDCSLLEIPIVGPLMTWMKGREAGKILERLDKGVANSEFVILFPTFIEKHTVKDSSDLLPLLFDFNEAGRNLWHRHKIFIFEHLWLNHDSCPRIVVKGWDVLVEGDMAGVAIRLASCGAALDEWNLTEFGSIPYAVREKKRKLATLLYSSDLQATVAAIDQCQKDLKTLQEHDEILWRQRSCDKWVREGDQNTSFFHKSASRRKRHNTIREVRDIHDVLHTNNSDMGHAFVEYFSSIFTSSADDVDSEVLEEITCSLSDGDKVLLNAYYNSDDVKETLDTMYIEKASGPDGMTVALYKKTLALVG